MEVAMVEVLEHLPMAVDISQDINRDMDDPLTKEEDMEVVVPMDVGEEQEDTLDTDPLKELLPVEGMGRITTGNLNNPMEVDMAVTNLLDTAEDRRETFPGNISQSLSQNHLITCSLFTN